MIPVDFGRLSRIIDYKFNNEELVKQALTHCSVSNQCNNERFEFLGDSILNFVIANTLFDRFPEKTEGELSRLRAHLVKGDTLAEIAAQIKLGDYLFLGQGELKSGGFRRSSILADALEAVIAAVYLDGGIEASRKMILLLFNERLSTQHVHDNLKDPKTQLQEYLQAEKLPLPEYELLSTIGQEHEQVFHVRCSLKNKKIFAEGKATNRRKAEQEAALKVLENIRQRP